MKVYKKLLFLGLTALAGVGASAQTIKDNSGYLQVFEVSSTLPEDKGKIYFENSDIKVMFQLWGDRGNMQISVQNKLDKPIYIAWDKSTYTNNGKVFTYTPEKDMTKENAKDYNKFLHEGRMLNTMDYEMAYQSGMEDAKDTKVETVTEVKAKGYYMRLKYHLLADEKLYQFESSATSTQESDNSKPAEKVDVYSVTFDSTASPLKFATMLVYATEKDNPTFTNVDAKFYVSKITEVPASHFKGEKTGKSPDGSAIYKFPFRKSNTFYVEINKKSAAAYKAKNKK